MSDGDDEYFKEELLRRSQQIAELKAELWEVRDRMSSTVDRTSSLLQGLVGLEAEAGIRKAKSNELEDKVHLEQHRLEDDMRGEGRRHAADDTEIVHLRQQIVELADERGRWHVEAEEVARQFAWKRTDVDAIQSVLDGKARERALAQSEHAQQQAAIEVMHDQQLAVHREHGQQRLRDAEEALANLSGDAIVAREDLLKLERTLRTERDCREGLERALQHTWDQNSQIREECMVLSRELQNLEAAEEEERLMDELTAYRMRCQDLSRDVANARRHALMHTQAIQGALEETRRMIIDHEDQTRLHLDQTQQRPNDSTLGVLTQALHEARKRKDSGIATKQHLERERNALEDEVRRAEAATAAENDREIHTRLAQTEEELKAARQELDLKSRNANALSDDLRAADSFALQVEASEQQQEILLRSKLEELWRVIRMYKPPAEELTPNTSFTSPDRHLGAPAIEHYGVSPTRRGHSPFRGVVSASMPSNLSPARFFPPSRSNSGIEGR